MNKDFEFTTELFDKYLNAELLPEEMKLVENRLQEDPRLMNEYNNLKMAIDAARLDGLSIEVAGIGKEYFSGSRGNKNNQSRGRIRSIGYYALRVAALLLVVAGSYLAILYATVSPEKIFADNYYPYELPASRSGSQTSDLEKFYISSQWNQVLALMEPLEDRTQKELYLGGLSAMRTAKFQYAIKLFEKLLENNQVNQEQSYQDGSEFYLALTYIKLGEYDKARTLFQLIRNDPRHAYNNQVHAMDLLKLKLLSWKK